MTARGRDQSRFAKLEHLEKNLTLAANTPFPKTNLPVIAAGPYRSKHDSSIENQLMPLLRTPDMMKATVFAPTTAPARPSKCATTPFRFDDTIPPLFRSAGAGLTNVNLTRTTLAIRSAVYKIFAVANE